MGLTQTKVVRETYTIVAILELFERGILRDNHPQQRRAGQHSAVYRDGFVATEIKQEDFNSLKICEQKIEGNNILWLIDGLQRLSETKGFRNGTFKLGRRIENPIVEYQTPKEGEVDIYGNPVYETKEFDIRGKGYNDLPRELQLQFDMCPIDIVKHLDCSEEEIAYHIRRYNRQTAMNGAQTSVTYADRWAVQIRNIAQNNRFFLDCGQYTTVNIKKSVIERIIMESIMSVFHLTDWKKQTNAMGQYINDNATQEEFDMLDGYFNRLYPIAEGKYKDFFNAKNTFLFMPLFHEYVGYGFPDMRFGNFLGALETELHNKEIDGVSYDSLNENRATKDRTVIMQKVNHLKKLMMDYFGVEENSDEELSDVEFISKVTGFKEEEISESIDFFNQCLDDSLDRVVEYHSKLRDSQNRYPLLAVLVSAYNLDEDIEPWLEWYALHNNTYIKNPTSHYKKMRESYINFNNSNQLIA